MKRVVACALALAACTSLPASEGGAPATRPRAVPSPSPSIARVEPVAPNRESEAPRIDAPSNIAPDTDAMGPAEVVDVRVAGDRSVHVVRGAKDESRALIYLPGRCGDDLAFRSWAEAARRFGTLIAMLGDERCLDSSRFKWGPDIAHIDRRIGAAVRAVNAALGLRLDATTVVLIGYSEGARRAESLVQRFPARYPRVLLAGSPRAPKRENLSKTRAIAVVTGELDRRSFMEQAANDLTAAGLRAAFFVLPGARHGQYGDEGERVMGQAIAWMLDRTQ